MTNHTLNANTTQESILETTVAPNLAEVPFSAFISHEKKSTHKSILYSFI